jgi:large subunit ribosomal protein L4
MNVSTPKLPEKLKQIKVNTALIHEVITAELSNRRQGTASTKTRREVSGGGKKPWRQKGTGRARVGSSRNPVWKGGGVTFGPTPERSYKKRLTKKKRQKATLQMIIRRIEENSLKVADEIKLDQPKTREAAKFLNEIFETNKYKMLVLVNNGSPEIYRSFKNISNVTVSDWKSLNAYKLLEHEKILFSREAWESFFSFRSIE